MYGVPADLDLSFLDGVELIQVCLGIYDVQFHFDPAVAICCGGSWSLLDENGVRIDHGQQVFPRPPFLLHRLLGQRIATWRVVPPTHLELIFERGECLRFGDNSERYESFTIQPGGNRGMIIV